MVDGKESYLDRMIDAIAVRVQEERRMFVTAMVDFEIEPYDFRLIKSCNSDDLRGIDGF